MTFIFLVGYPRLFASEGVLGSPASTVEQTDFIRCNDLKLEAWGLNKV